MRIDLDRLKKAGFRVDIHDTDDVIDIYPVGSNNIGAEMYKVLKNKTDLPEKTLGRLTDDFSDSLVDEIIFDTIKRS